MGIRIKVFTTANKSQIFEDVPSTDGLVDIDSVQTVSNKTLVATTITIGTSTSTVTLENLSRYFYLLLKANMLGCGWNLSAMLGVSPGLSTQVNTALGMT